MRKRLLSKSLLKTEPDVYQKVAYEFLDHEKITEAQLADAEVTLKAFFYFNDLTYDPVSNGIFPEDGPIPVDVILKNCLPVTHEAVEDAIKKVMATYPPSRITARLVGEEPSDLQKWRLQQNTPMKELEQEEQQEDARFILKHLAGRKKEWTLLGVKSRESLNKIITDCFGLPTIQKMRKTGCLSTKEVQLLVARHMIFGQNRTKNPNAKKARNPLYSKA